MENVNVKEAMKGKLVESKPISRKPKGGNFISDTPYDIKPVLERIAIVADAYNELKEYINATDRTMITEEEKLCFNNIAKAFENALLTMKSLI